MWEVKSSMSEEGRDCREEQSEVGIQARHYMRNTSRQQRSRKIPSRRNNQLGKTVDVEVDPKEP